MGGFFFLLPGREDPGRPLLEEITAPTEIGALWLIFRYAVCYYSHSMPFIICESANNRQK